MYIYIHIWLMAYDVISHQVALDIHTRDGRMWHEIGEPKRGIQLGCHEISVPNLKMVFFVRLKLGCTLQFWLS